jgi:hypothetical protein
MATTTGNNPDEIQLTHAEIWDDSTLVEAWDEALAEYKVIGYFWRLVMGRSLQAYVEISQHCGYWRG